MTYRGKRRISKEWIASILVLSLSLLIMGAGCASQDSQTPQTDQTQHIEGAWITGVTLDRADSGRNSIFTIRDGDASDVVGIDFRGNLSKGDLRVQLRDKNDAVVWQEAVTSGPFVVNTTLDTLPPGEYRLGLEWQGPVQAQYALTWKPGPVETPRITPLALLSGLGMFAVAAGFLVYGLRRGLSRRYLALGALAWGVTVALKFAWAIPINTPIYNALTHSLPLPVALPIFSVYVGALTGIFEVGITYLVLRYTRLGKASWPKALAFGIGFGAVEALLLSISPLVASITALTNPAALPPSALESLARLNDPLLGMAPVWERFFTVWIHIASCVLIFWAVASRRLRWFWLAFAFKTLIDTAAAYGQISGNLASLTNLWALEAVVALWGMAGWWLAARIQQKFSSAAQPLPTPTTTQ